MINSAPVTQARPTPHDNYVLKPDRFSSHARIGRYLRRCAERDEGRPYVVLDIGCATGFLRHFLPAPNFYLIGIDRESEYVERARAVYDETFQADLAAGAPALPMRHEPDAIVFADVLEHLAEPAAALTNSLNHLLPAGKQVIISLPNIAHLYVRLSLLAGRFEYADCGLLDRTHLRFFTLQSALRLCTASNIRVARIETTPAPLPRLHPLFGEQGALFPLHSFNASLASIFRTLLGYQFIFYGTYAP